MTVATLLQLLGRLQTNLVGLAPHLIGVLGQRAHALDAFLVSPGHAGIVNGVATACVLENAYR
jgi:hypothetical protein